MKTIIFFKPVLVLFALLSMLTMLSCGDDDSVSSCIDNIMNGDEVGVDCGGQCPACFSCSDGILNGNETGIDCGGECIPCPTCVDGILNGNETGIDCGGSCPPCVSPGCTDPNADVDDDSCETCDDRILNGDETGVDCGGMCPNVCTFINEVELPGNPMLRGSILTSDNNIVIYGTGFAVGNVFISKIDRKGEVDWQYTTDELSVLTGIVEASNGDLVAIGSLSGQTVVTRISSSGDEIWTKTIVRFNQGVAIEEQGLSITNSIDGGLILVTSPALLNFPAEPSDMNQILKIDDNGNLDVFWGGASQSQNLNTNGVNDIISVSDGYVMGAGGGVMVKTDDQGVIVWTKEISTEGDMVDVIELDDGSLVTTGGFGPGADASFGLIKRNSEGTEIWSEMITSQPFGPGSGRDVINSANGNLIVVGFSAPEQGARIERFVKYDMNGSEILRTEIDMCSFSSYSVYEDVDSGFLMVATSNCSAVESKITILKLNSNGQF